MLRRLHADQPESFAFTPANQAWAEAQITKYPQGRQASAIIPLLWRAQEQEGWLTHPAIERIAEMLDMAYIRALEVASFYFMFQLQPVGSVAHIQICGTTSCMICGAEDLAAVCREKIAAKPHMLSEDGKFSWEEVECLGACANAPMAQIGKDYYEDLTAEGFAAMLDEMAAGKVPTPGPQNGRFASEPKAGLTTLKEFDSGKTRYNASVQLATDLGDTIKRIDGSEVPLLSPWQDHGANHHPSDPAANLSKPPKQATVETIEKTPHAKPQDKSKSKAKPLAKSTAAPGAAAKDAASPAKENVGKKPQTLSAPQGDKAEDLKLIKGVGPKLEKLLHHLGFFHFAQLANWTDEEVAWVDENLEGFKGRVSRDNWVEQAKILASGGETEFSARSSKDKAKS
jgi:NADH-quinone oxidoreductase subunit E